jgi:hypothetical protein
MEVGAHNTRRRAVVGEFRPARKIRVVDMTALPELPSIFSEDVAECRPSHNSAGVSVT